MNLTLVQETDDFSQLALAGRLDATGVAALEQEFLAHTAGRQKHALVDCGAVTFIASMGMRMLISAAQALHRAGFKLILINPQPLVKNALELAGLTSILLIAPDTMQAVALLANE